MGYCKRDESHFGHCRDVLKLHHLTAKRTSGNYTFTGIRHNHGVPLEFDNCKIFLHRNAVPVKMPYYFTKNAITSQQSIGLRQNWYCWKNEPIIYTLVDLEQENSTHIKSYSFLNLTLDILGANLS